MLYIEWKLKKLRTPARIECFDFVCVSVVAEVSCYNFYMNTSNDLFMQKSIISPPPFALILPFSFSLPYTHTHSHSQTLTLTHKCTLSAHTYTHSHSNSLSLPISISLSHTHSSSLSHSPSSISVWACEKFWLKASLPIYNVFTTSTFAIEQRGSVILKFFAKKWSWLFC